MLRSISMSIIPKRLALPSFTSKRVRIVAVSAFGIALVVAVVGLIIKLNQPDTETKKALNACEKVNKDANLCAFISTLDLKKLAYRLDITTTDPEGGKNTSTYLADGTGNAWLSTKVGAQETVWLLANKTTYLKTGGEWLKLPADTSKTPPIQSPAESIQLRSVIGDKKQLVVTPMKKAGTERCGALKCTKYQFLDLSGQPATSYLWLLSVGENRLYRYRAEFGKASTDMIFSYQTINITAPANAKDFAQSTLQTPAR